MGKLRVPVQPSFDSLYTHTFYLGLYNTSFSPHGTSLICWRYWKDILWRTQRLTDKKDTFTVEAAECCPRGLEAESTKDLSHVPPEPDVSGILGFTQGLAEHLSVPCQGTGATQGHPSQAESPVCQKQALQLPPLCWFVAAAETLHPTISSFPEAHPAF